MFHVYHYLLWGSTHSTAQACTWALHLAVIHMACWGLNSDATCKAMYKAQ